MVSLDDYVDREQAYVKHIFLKRYLETLFHKTGSTYSHIVYVDGFAGPWQSADENFDDTSFGVALNALRAAKASLKQRRREVKMTALLVEQDKDAYAKLETIKVRFSDIEVKTYAGNFVALVPTISRDIPTRAFTFFLLDPKGWRIPLQQLRPLLRRQNSEVVFNFMFEFINRAAGMNVPVTVQGLDELMPYSNWQQRLREAQERFGVHELTMDDRKDVLVGCFGASLKQIGGYRYVAELTILRPLTDRSLYCLVYGSRHAMGILTFRDCQRAAVKMQAELRAAGKIKNKATLSGQAEMFESMLDLAPDKTATRLAEQRRLAAKLVLELVPKAPASIDYMELWATVLSKHDVTKPDVNKMCAEMKDRGELLFPDWESGRRTPQDAYRMQRP